MTELTNSDYEMALSVLNNLDIPENTPHNLIGISFAKEALKKQMPKKPIITIDGFFNGQPIYDTWGCPTCGKVNETDFEDYEYCPICGQALDWSDTK